MDTERDASHAGRRCRFRRNVPAPASDPALFRRPALKGILEGPCFVTAEPIPLTRGVGVAGAVTTRQEVGAGIGEPWA